MGWYNPPSTGGVVTSWSADGTGLTPSTPTTGAVVLGGILNIASGGTNGSATPTAGAVAYGTGTAYGFTAAGTAGQYLQSTGSGVPTWATVSSATGSPAYYGLFISSSNQLNGGSTSANLVTFDASPVLNNGVSVVSSSQITFANAGQYAIIAELAITNSTGSNPTFYTWMAQNGTNLASTTQDQQFLGGANNTQMTTCTWIINANAGDYAQIYWSCSATTVSLVAQGALTTPTRPASPSAIVSVYSLPQIGLGYAGLTSTTSTTIGTGSKTFTVNLPNSSDAYVVGSRVRVASSASPSNFMEGVITAYSGTSLTVNVDSTGGSGTFASWNFSLAGIQGNAGLTVGTTTVSGGTTTRVLYDNAGVIGEYASVPIANGGTGATTASAGFNALSPITSTGDLILGNGVNSATRLAIGTNGYVLTSNGTTASWAAAAGGSLTVGTTSISGGTSGRVLYDNAGVLGEYSAVPIANGGTGATTASAGFNALSPITSTGDLIIGNGTSSATRLGIGINGYVLTSNGTTASWAAIPAASLTVGTSTISGGTSGRVLYDNAGVVGELANTGTGNNVLATSPTLVTPALGTPTSGTLTNCTGLPYGGLTNVTVVPQGRLTLVTGTPVMTSAQTAKTTIYYTPYVGALIPIYNGTAWTLAQMSSDLSNITTNSATGNAGPAAVTTNSNYDLFVWSNAGTLTLTRGPAWTSDTARGTGAGTTQIAMQNGIWTNAVAITNGPSANQGTYVGTVRSDGSSQLNWNPTPAAAAGGAEAKLHVFNTYNRVLFCAASLDNTSSWTYSTATWRSLDNSTTNRISYIDGLGELNINANFLGVILQTAGLYNFGINRDSTSAQPTTATVQQLTSNNSNFLNQIFIASLGYHYLQAMEVSRDSTSVTVYGNNAVVSGTGQCESLSATMSL